ncbi:hypothetical protein CCR96_23745 [Halochromatium roseum]|nr:hypothetical protein [Halochromatium roseum]
MVIDQVEADTAALADSQSLPQVLRDLDLPQFIDGRSWHQWSPWLGVMVEKSGYGGMLKLSAVPRFCQ